ncbi:acyltransferase family protein [Streptomyces olivoreticuli]
MSVQELPTPAAGSRPPKLPSLTGLRFFAAALVFCFHTSLPKMLRVFEDDGVAHGYARAFAKAGWVGVSFFFILSGFVLAWSARPRDSLGGFYRRRLLKIYPNHVVTWALTMVLFAASTTGPAVWLPNLLLLHSWIPDLDTFVSVNQPSWSLCSELLFYLLFPVLWRLVRRIPAHRLWWWAAATVAGLVVCQLAVDFLVPGTPRLAEWPLSEWQWWLSYNIPPLRLFEFVLGMLMARILLSGRWLPLGLAPAFALTAAGYGLALVVPWQYGLNVATIVPLALLVTAVAAADVKGSRTLLRGRTMVWLGEISFAFYLTHYIVLVELRRLLDGRLFSTPAAIGVLVGAFLLAQFTGWLLYACVERPVMRRWGRAKPKGPLPPARTTETREPEPAR